MPGGLAGEFGVADAVEAAVDAVQSTARDSASDLTVYEARAKELNEGY
jgi:hypothetical protein